MGADGAWQLDQRGETCVVCLGGGRTADANSGSEAAREQPPTVRDALCSVLIRRQTTSCAAGAHTTEEEEGDKEVWEAGALIGGMRDSSAEQEKGMMKQKWGHRSKPRSV